MVCIPSIHVLCTAKARRRRKKARAVCMRIYKSLHQFYIHTHSNSRIRFRALSLSHLTFLAHPYKIQLLLLHIINKSHLFTQNMYNTQRTAPIWNISNILNEYVCAYMCCMPFQYLKFYDDKIVDF